MKVLCICILATLACFLSYTEAAVSLAPAEVDPKRPNGCLWTNPNNNQKIYHANGASWRLGPCGRATCKKEGGRLMLLQESCGVIAVEPPCRLSKVDSSKIYPECCPKPICP